MSSEKQSENISSPNIAIEIKRMVDVDQAMRERSGEDDFWDEKIDARNTERMKKIAREIDNQSTKTSQEKIDELLESGSQKKTETEENKVS